MIKILIVEDDPAIAEIHRRFVQRLAGFEVLGVALTLFDAREQIGILKPDLVLLDVWLPDGEGFSLLRELRQAGAGLDVILLTAAREASALQEAMRLGVVDFILKPVVFERLRDTLGNYAESRAALAALADIDQQAVDALLGTPLQQVAAAGLPKGIDALTLQRVLAALTSVGASAEEIGNRVGVSRTTARRYLEFLVGQQLASPELEYGTVGRPERRYQSILKRQH
ncbi:response regulator [Aeromonas piscicola]|uniref:response regulator n=1 Tax=Aeromonas piscicola TaxID=600645 RepID=UPI0005B32C6B|nr:response regulator [Aeromonas piscicola]